jgi:hypothetical protein
MQRLIIGVLCGCLATPVGAANIGGAAAAARAANAVKGALGVSAVPRLGSMPLGGSLSAGQSPASQLNINLNSSFSADVAPKVAALLAIAPAARVAAPASSLNLALPTSLIDNGSGKPATILKDAAVDAPLRQGHRKSQQGKGGTKTTARAASPRSVLESLQHELEDVDITGLAPAAADDILARVWDGIERRERLDQQLVSGGRLTLGGALDKHLPVDHLDRTAVVKMRTEIDGNDSLLAALRLPANGLVAGGDEAIVFELAPTEELLLERGFRNAVSVELERQPFLRARLERRVNEFDGGQGDQNRTATLRDGLPENLVVKIISPHEGVWENEWGLRPFDAPIYARRELDDGSIVIVQEKVDVGVGAMDRLQVRLGPDFALLDQANRMQAGIDDEGNAVLVDYGAVGKAYEFASPLAQMTNVKAAADGFDEMTSEEEDRLELARERDQYATSEEGGDRLAKLQEAVKGRGRYADLDEQHQAILNLVIEEIGTEARVTSDHYQNIVVMWAVQHGMAVDDIKASSQVDAVLEWGVEQVLFER